MNLALKVTLLRWYYQFDTHGATQNPEILERVIALTRQGLISGGVCTVKGRKEIASWGDDKEAFAGYRKLVADWYEKHQGKID
jgi:hypothetical protein